MFDVENFEKSNLTNLQTKYRITFPWHTINSQVSSFCFKLARWMYFRKAASMRDPSVAKFKQNEQLTKKLAN